jgi:hypothetical protein
MKEEENIKRQDKKEKKKPEQEEEKKEEEIWRSKGRKGRRNRSGNIYVSKKRFCLCRFHA